LVVVRDKKRAVPAALRFLISIDAIPIYYYSIDVNISLKTEPWIRPDPHTETEISPPRHEEHKENLK
jgi:hypothetical protein